MKKFRDKNALIIVDIQKFFINKYTSSLPGKIANYIEINKHRFDLIIFSIFVNNRQTILFNELKWKACLKSPDIDIVPTLAVLSKKYKLVKRSTYSVFNSKDIIKLLIKNKIKKCIYVV